MLQRHIFITVMVSGLTFALGHAQQPTQKGRVQVRKYFATEVKQIADSCLANIKTKEDWEKIRPEMRRQFLDMMGLWPLPKKTDLKVTITGKVDAEKFTIEKLHFQSSPGLYVTGNLYVPKNLKKPTPAVLYVCGHARTQIDGVNYGHHVNYQHHPRWFAEHGYVCLIIDTLQLGEIPGIHHGTYSHKMWWWHNRGYTSAGIECWNAMRALDYLQSRKEVDGKRIGVTGRSGGGATSWWVAAADDRVKCIIPVAGITSLRSHLIAAPSERFREGVISGHCDCMYMTNTHRWDFPMVAALCAPRPLMLGNSDKDLIFPVPGYRHIVDKVKKIYRLYDAEGKFTVLETGGPHKDTPELRIGAFYWMNLWLKYNGKDVEGNLSDPERPRFSPQQLKVLKQIPEDSINAKIQETFIPIANPTLPKGKEEIADWWKTQQPKWKKQLAETVFGGQTKNPVELDVKKTHDVTRSGLRLQAFDFHSDHSTELTLWLLTAKKAEKKTPLVVLNVLDEDGWQELQTEFGGTFAKELGLEKSPQVNKKAVEQTQRVLKKFGWAYAYVVPRGMGPTRWAKPGTREDYDFKRRFALIGQTLDGQRVRDVRRALAVLRGLPSLHKVPLWVQGKRQMAGVALYVAIFEPDVARLDLWDVPTTHKDGPFLLNIRKIFDMPQAVAMVFPRRVYIYVRKQQQSESWDWPIRMQQALGKPHLKIRVVPQ